MALVDADALTEEARAVKCPDEITAMRCAVHAWEAAVGEMRAAFEPGATEMALWSVPQAGNLARYGEWIETRLLASGPRTNPWYQEASSEIRIAHDIEGTAGGHPGGNGQAAMFSSAGDGGHGDEIR